MSVRGPSMVPTLRSGDLILVNRRARVRPGDVVIARFPHRPDLLVVKRAVRPEGGGWYVAGDNPYAVGDSSAHGPAEIVGRVVLRYWPRPRWRLRGSPDPGAVRHSANEK